MTMPMKMTITVIDYIENDDGNVNEDVHDDSRNDDMMMTMTKNDRRENDNNHVDNDDNDDGDNRGGTSDSSIYDFFQLACKPSKCDSFFLESQSNVRVQATPLNNPNAVK